MMLRPRLRIPRVPLSPSLFLQRAPRRRSLHTIPELNYKWPEDEGQSQLLSRFGFDVSWNQYQSMLLNKLNVLTMGTSWESKDLKAVLIETARDPELAATFNYASMAHNNHFFFKNLAAEPVEMPGTLEQTLKASFGSIETLRREMVYTASAMFGPGFVWLVKQQQGGSVSFKVLATYLAGSPYAGAHWRRQNVDLNTAVGSTEQGVKTARRYLEDTAYGTTGRKPADKRHDHAPGGTDVVPVLCLNVWEHVYLPDYGIAGKYAFAEEWWKYINWDAVTETAGLSKEIAWGGARGSS